MKEIRCGNCGSTIKVGDGEGVPFGKLPDGIHYLVPSVVRNENLSNSEKKLNSRLDALKKAGINVDKLRDLMGGSSSFKDIFEEDDPIIKELSSGGFIRNNELFRRWITAQTFALLKNPKGWTYAVRQRYDIRYVYRQTVNELRLLCKLIRKGLKGKDRRFEFFTFEDLKKIFLDLNKYNRDYIRPSIEDSIKKTYSYEGLLDVVTRNNFYFNYKCTFMPPRWLNCFKGAGAYYTLQNIIRTHGLVLPKCKDMNESLDWVENTFKNIIGYEPSQRRWDILMTVLTSAIKETGFELKY